MSLTGRLIFAITSAAIGSSFQHGYNTGVPNTPHEVVKQFINKTLTTRNGVGPSEAEITVIFSLLVGIFALGGMFGALATAFVANKFGRKGGLLLNNILAIVPAVLFFISESVKSYEVVIVARFLIGVNCGLNNGLGTLYLNEISPTSIRGAVGTIYQLVITFSILISQILGLRQVMGTEKLWPVVYGFTLIPILIMLPTLPFCPESPKYLLINKGNDVDAQKALAWLRGTEEVQEEVDELRAESAAVQSIEKVTLTELFRNPILRMPLMIAIVIMLSQQFSGINAAIFFSSSIFVKAGLSGDKATLATLGIGLANFFMTIVSMLLVDKAGRRTLHITGLTGMMICTIILTVTIELGSKYKWLAFLSIAMVILFVIMFSIGPGSIPWFLVTEMFGQGARPIATSIAVAVNWGANLIVGFGFLPLSEAIGAYAFLVFTVLLLIFIVYTYFEVPETKHKTVEEMEAYFKQRT